MRFKNPWSDTAGFIDLGILARGGVNPINCDLYVFPSADGRTLNFGGRHSDEDGDYTSGSCYLQDSGEWDIMGDISIQTAAARYFSNYHGKKAVYDPKISACPQCGFY
jgi:hypothetical protein